GLAGLGARAVEVLAALERARAVVGGAGCGGLGLGTARGRLLGRRRGVGLVGSAGGGRCTAVVVRLARVVSSLQRAHPRDVSPRAAAGRTGRRAAPRPTPRPPRPPRPR